MPNDTKPDVILVLDGSFSVSQKLYDEVRKQVIFIEPALIPDYEYTLQILLVPEYWESLSDYQRRLAGRCMAYMVKKGIVPYDFAGKECQSPKVYAVIR